MTNVLAVPGRRATGAGSSVLARTLVTATAPIAWGTTYAVTTELLPDGHPLLAGLLRALPAGLIAIAVSRQLPRGVWWWRSAVLGVLNIGLFFPLLFTSAERLPGGVAATLGAVQPLIVALLAVVILGERLSSWRVGWGLVGVVGVGLVVLGPAARLDGAGLVAGLVGASSMALGVTLTKRWGRPAGVTPTALAGWQLTAGGLFLLPLTAVVEGAPPAIDVQAVVGYGWLGLVGGLAAYVVWFRGIGSLPVASVAVLSLLSPMVAAVLGVVALGESLSLLQVAGFALALAAVVAGQITPRRRPSRHPVRGATTRCVGQPIHTPMEVGR